jgi:hypothetical protein
LLHIFVEIHTRPVAIGIYTSLAQNGIVT